MTIMLTIASFFIGILFGLYVIAPHNLIYFLFRLADEGKPVILHHKDKKVKIEAKIIK